MKKNLFLSAVFAMTLSAPATANDLLNGWTGETSLAGSITSGNTETTDIGLALKLAKESDLWRHKFKGLVDYGTNNNVDSKSRYSLGYQIDRDINDRTYVYANADYFSDEFGAFQDGYFLGGGLGYKVILPAPVSWNVEGGAGFRSQTEQDLITVDTTVTPNVITTTAGASIEEFALRGFSDFDYEINDNVSLFNDTEILWSEADTYIWNDIGLTAQLSDNLAARASFRVDNHSTVPVGREKTDTVTRFGIVYSMK